MPPKPKPVKWPLDRDDPANIEEAWKDLKEMGDTAEQEADARQQEGR